MKGPFDFVNDINEGKKYLWHGNENHYDPFLTLRALSQHVDTIMEAQELNERSLKEFRISPKMHHDFLFHGVERGRRFGKWPKKQHIENLVSLATELEISEERAKEIIDFIPEDYFDRNRKGGMKR